MDPRDFLQVAVALSARPTEAERRTAVSRAYYASFHVALQLVDEKCGVVVPIHQAHVKLCYCLQHVGKNTDAYDAGRILDALREARRIADYELSDNAPKKPSWAAFHVRQTQDIIDALDRCSVEPNLSVVIEAVRGYAHDRLGWLVRDAKS
jgi:hypothetical protein